MIKAIIFDLDLCILDNSTMPAGIIDTLLVTLFSSNLSEERKKEIRAAMRGNALEHVLREQKVPEEIAEPMRQAYREVELHPEVIIKTYGDESAIESLPTKNILVTSGYRKFQQSKIDLLNIKHLFDEIIIDLNDDPKAWKGKKQIFSELLQKEGWKPEEVLVVGDNPKSELLAAKELGMKAIQTLRPGVVKWEEADVHIASLHELKDLI
jgi:HAD superfamily hydrolase (TIGR01509 family)